MQKRKRDDYDFFWIQAQRDYLERELKELDIKMERDVQELDNLRADDQGNLFSLKPLIIKVFEVYSLLMFLNKQGYY